MKKNALTRGKKQSADLAAREGRLDEAHALFQAVCRVDPGDVESWVKLSLIEKRLGHLPAALACAERALALSPKLGYAHHAQAVALHSLGRLDEATAHYRRACELQPDFADAHYMLGTALYDQGQAAAAVVAYRQALRLQPQLVDAWVNLGAALLGRGETEEALQVLNRALALQPDHVLALTNLAQAQRAAGLAAAAEQTCQRALRLQPESPDLMAGLADLLEKGGGLDLARDWALRGLTLAPGHAQLNLVMAQIERRDGRPADAMARLEALRAQDLNIDQLGDVELALGQLHDQLGQPEAAFAMMAAGKHKKALIALPGGVYDGAYLRRITAVSRWSTPALAAAVLSARSTAPARADPVFMVGFPRSGTTLLEHVLESHPAVQALEEKSAVDAMVDAFLATAGDDADALAALAPARVGELRALYFEVVRRHIDPRPGALLLDKLPLNAVNAPLILRVFPHARFILALRHPADACLSCLMQNFAVNPAMSAFYSLADAVQLYAMVMQAWQRYATELPLACHRVRYEDLTADLARESRAVLDFLGLPWDDAVLRFNEHAASRSNINSPSYHQVVQPIYQHARYRWTRYARHFETLLPQLQPYVDLFGYAPTAP